MREAVQQSIESGAPKVTYVAAGAAAAAGWGVMEWAAFTGLVIAVLTYVTGLVFQVRRDRRERERTNAYLDAQKGSKDKDV